ncbi:hypothetical protein LOTGIDRAFT_84168, partial [Lottia gigantea]
LDYVILVIQAFVSLFIIVINSFLIYTLSVTMMLKTKANIIITSLAAADLLVGITLPVGTIFEFKFIDDFIGCTATYCLSILLTTVSMHHLFMVSFDRYILIIYPLRYPLIMTTKRCMLSIAFSWIASLTFAVLPIFGIGRPPSADVKCNAERFFEWWYILILYLVNFQIPLLIMVYIYGKIYVIAKKHRRQIESEMNYFKTNARQNIKTTKILFAMCLYFQLSWLPYFTITFVYLIVPDITIPLIVLRIAVLLAFANSLGNPLLYGFFNRNVRCSVKTILKCKK